MTNAEKYLKVSIKDFFSSIMKSQIDISGLYSLEKWLLSEAKPTLTEDERVILRNTTANTCNAKNHYITRTKGSGRVRIKFKENGEEGYFNFAGFDHLFQFIKERRRI